MTDWEQVREVAGEIIRHFEGDKLTSYVLPGETWATISVGVAIPLSQHPKTITQIESDALFKSTLARKEAQLRKEIPASVLESMTVGELAGTLSFRYNAKDTIWLSSKCKTRKMLVAGDIDGFKTMHSLWINGDGGKLAGLQRRRRVEREVMDGKPMTKIRQARWYMGVY